MALALAWCHPAVAQAPVAETVKVAPQMRVLPWPSSPSSASPPGHEQDVDARLTDADALWLAPRIVGTWSGRRLIGPGDLVLADPSAGTVELFDIVRGPQPLVQRSTGQVLGHQVQVIGTARRVADPRSATASGMHLRVVHARLEISAGDRLLPVTQRLSAHTDGQAVPTAFEAVVLALPDGRHGAGPGEVVALDRGRLDGLAPGHLLQVYRPSASGGVAGAQASAHARLMVTQTHLRVARALIVDARDAVHQDDLVVPDHDRQSGP